MPMLRLGNVGYNTSGPDPFAYLKLTVSERTATLLSGDLLRWTGKPGLAVQITGQFEAAASDGLLRSSMINAVRATLDGALLYELSGLSQSVIAQHVVGHPERDFIVSGSEPRDIFAGDDTFIGGAGNDVLAAYAGDDLLLGGGGNDWAEISAYRSQVAALRWRDEALITHSTPNRYDAPETDRLGSIEAVRFSDGAVALADLPQFRPLQYLASYADLTAAYGTDQDRAWQHFFNTGLAEQRQVTFSGHAYLASYGDLRAAYGTDAEAAARHYLLYGRAEGRTVTSEFSAAQYLAANVDLRAAFGADLDRAAQHHLQSGAAEGRVTSFDGLGYIASYRDLIRVLPHTVDAGAMHFVEVGAKAGLGITFDALRYIASSRDLIAEFGIDAVRGTRHYVDTGVFESRSLSRFDVARYLETHADLRAAFGTDTRAATVHWIETGADEGRTGFHDPPAWYGSYGSGGTLTRIVADTEVASSAPILREPPSA